MADHEIVEELEEHLNNNNNSSSVIKPENGELDKHVYTTVTSLENSINEKHDSWLQENDLTIKTMPRNKDSQSLFRAVSEKLFSSQGHYEKVKNQVIKYLTDRRALVEQKIRLAYAKEMFSKPLGQLEKDVYDFGMVCGKEPVTPWHAYMYRLENGCNVAGAIELSAISSLYKHNILVYRAIPSVPLIFGKYDVDDSKTIKLLNFFGSNHYDLLITTSSAKSEALCQSVVYELLYEKVFGLQNTLESTMAASSATLGKEINKLGEHEERRTKRFANKLEGNETEAIKYMRSDILPFPLKIAKGLDSTPFHDSNLDN